MRSILFSSVVIFLQILQTSSYTPPSCRFSPKFREINSTYINDLLYWEGKFIQNGIGYNAKNGMSYDGTLIDQVTGKSLRGVNVSGMGDGGHPFSAASKEVGFLLLFFPVKARHEKHIVVYEYRIL